MKRFLRFDYDDRMPIGGTGDLVAEFDTLAEAQVWDDGEWRDSHFHCVVLDTQTGDEWAYPVVCKTPHWAMSSVASRLAEKNNKAKEWSEKQK